MTRWKLYARLSMPIYSPGTEVHLMEYEPFDAPYRPTRPGAECSAMLVHRASFATNPVGRFGAPYPLWKLLKTCDKRAGRNYPPAALNSASGTPTPQKPVLRATRLACEQFRFGQTIHISSNVLKQLLTTRNHLTDFPRLLARHAFHFGLSDHKESMTTSKKAQKNRPPVGQIRSSTLLNS